MANVDPWPPADESRHAGHPPRFARLSTVPSRDKLPLLLIAAFWGGLYLPHLFAGQTLPARDVGATQIPWRTVWRQQVLAGAPPLWDPASNGGRPLLANPNTMAAYPGTLLFLAMSPEAAAGWHIALHHLLLLLGCYRLARRSGAGPQASAVAAAAVGTCGVAWSSLTFLNFQASLAWAVWALTTVVPAPPAGVPALRRALAGGSLIGLAFLGGEPVTAAFGGAAWCLVALSTWGRRAWLRLVPFAGAAFLLAAPVLVPLLAVYPDSVRGALPPARGAISADALAPRRLLELLFPGLLGPPLGDAGSGFWAGPSFPWQRYYPLVFVGALPLLCLPFARRAGRPLAPWWALVAAGAAGAIALAPAAVGDRVRDLPVLGAIRYAVKFLVLAVLAAPPLVAAGWESLAARWSAGGRRVVRAAAVAMAVASPLALFPSVTLRPALAALYPASRATLADVTDRTLARAALADWAALALPVATVALAGPAPLCATAAALVAGAVGGSGVLLFDADARWAAPPPARAALPAEPVLAVLEAPDPALRAASPLHRFWISHTSLVPEAGTRWGVRYVLNGGPDGLEPVSRELLAGATAHMGVAERARVAAALGATAVACRSELAGWHGAREGDLWFGSVPRPSPPFYVARRLLPAAGMLTAATLMAADDFRPGEDAVVAGGGGAAETGSGSAGELPGPPHHRRFDVTAVGPGLLVVQQSFMRCWRATVDGSAVRPEPANGGATGVRVPGGRHRVELFLDPLPYRIGAAGPVLLLLAAVLTRRAGPSRDRAAASRVSARRSPATPPAR